MANNGPKLNKSIPPKNVASTDKVVHPSAAKVDDRSAMEFSELLNRRGQQDAVFEREREIHASLTESENKGSIAAERNRGAAQSVSGSPNLFFQTHAHHGHSIIEETSFEKPQASGGATNQAGATGMPSVVSVQGESSRPAVEQIVEAVYRNWQSQESLAGGQRWAVQLSTGNNTTSELEIEYTATGEWRLKISDEAKSGSTTANEEGLEESIAQNWDHQQFCIELEACLKESRPDINFSSPVHS